MSSNPLEVTFVVSENETWVDPDGVAWYVRFYDSNNVYLERVITNDVPIKDFVRKFRRIGEE